MAKLLTGVVETDKKACPKNHLFKHSGNYLDMALSYISYFTKWKNWKELEPKFDGLNGVYAFRLKKLFPRIKGESQVVYIGMCNQNPKRNKRPGLWYRLKNYKQNLLGGPRRLRLLSEYIGGDEMIEYAYEVCENPRETEKALLDV